MGNKQVELIVTDLDDTLWNWFETWHASFDALINSLAIETGLDRDTLLNEAAQVHSQRGTSEYSFLVDEMPSLKRLAGGKEPRNVFGKSVHEWNSKRAHTIRLYPHVEATLKELGQLGIPVVAYTESQAFWTNWRMKRLGLDGLIDTVYSQPDHTIPPEVDVMERRMKPKDEYELHITGHEYTPEGQYKPSKQILRSILRKRGVDPENTIYVGDSLMKDIVMAKETGALAVHAEYGVQVLDERYDLLRRVTHWSESDVEGERQCHEQSGPVPDLILRNNFGELFDHMQDKTWMR